MSNGHRIEVMHGVNFDVLDRRDPALYGGLSLLELERRIESFAQELGLRVRFFQTNFEGEMVERMHRLAGEADAVLINAGAWTHYAWAIRDALEVAKLPSVEVHLSDVDGREQWRRVSIFEGLCLAKFAGEGPEGYRLGLQALSKALTGTR
ncbi:MAG TPA: type II 3-dehydroquinate dehydratase [Solirubrobacteraceae bacterium]|jgi:3-dehydroquinate dehydratase-2